MVERAYGSGVQSRVPQQVGRATLATSPAPTPLQRSDVTTDLSPRRHTTCNQEAI